MRNERRSRTLALKRDVRERPRRSVNVNGRGTDQMDALEDDAVVTFADNAAFPGDMALHVTQEEARSEIVERNNGPLAVEVHRAHAGNRSGNTGQFQTVVAALVERQPFEVQRRLLSPNRLFLAVGKRHVREGDQPG